MYNFPLGVLLDSFKCDTTTALKYAKEVGVCAGQLYAVKGELDARTVTKSTIRELRANLADNALVVSAVCGDFISGNHDGYSFSDPGQSDGLVERSKRILEFAASIGSDIVTTHIGVVPSDPNCAKYKILQETCGKLAEYADSMHAHFAIETGPEVATTLRGFLKSLGSRGVGVNLDPANLVMVTGDDPVRAVHTLKDYIVHTHAKDGRRLMVGDPLIIYGEIEAEICGAKYFEELPLGEGDVDFPAYLAALDEVGYRGYLTIEREVGTDPKADILKAVNFLNRIKDR